MKSFGVDAEWIPGEERRHRLKMTAMKPSGNHPSAASVAGRHRRRAESARAACPRRWVGSRGGCALLSLHTGSRYLAMPSRPSRWHCETSGTRAPRMLHWYRMTGVRLVRDTSVDHSGTLAGRIGCLCAAHGIQALLSHRHRRACPRHSPCCHGRSQRIICTGCRRRPVDRHRHGRGLWEHLWGSQRHLGRWHNTGRHSVVSRGCSSAVCSRLCEPRTCQKSAVQDALGGRCARRVPEGLMEGGRGEARSGQRIVVLPLSLSKSLSISLSLGVPACVSGGGDALLAGADENSWQSRSRHACASSAFHTPSSRLHAPCAIQQQATVMVLLEASAIARNVGRDLVFAASRRAACSHSDLGCANYGAEALPV